jgi:hypothetical protein
MKRPVDHLDHEAHQIDLNQLNLWCSCWLFSRRCAQTDETASRPPRSPSAPRKVSINAESSPGGPSLRNVLEMKRRIHHRHHQEYRDRSGSLAEASLGGPGVPGGYFLDDVRTQMKRRIPTFSVVLSLRA